ncbi:MAG TPA: SMP-30/gluconolactonase/LRE family protein [Candidatus Baltobacteraceae bacterium]
MERIRPTLFFIAIVAGALLAACGGGSAPAGFFSSGSPLPGLRLSPEAVTVVVKPHALSFSSLGTSFAQKVVVSEKGYKDKFVEHTTCKGIAKAAPLSGEGPKLTVKVTPLGTGTCAITFQDAKKHKSKLAIVVSTTKPTPSPSSSPTPYSTPTPTPCPSCPTPTPRPTSTPNAGTIFVTYAASTAHPNVVAYDAQGNKKTTGTWGSSGSSPQSIAWAPGDLNWFYVVNGGTNTVKVYSSSGGQLSSFFTGVTAAGAMAYPSGVSNLLYVASTSQHTIYAYDEDGNVKSAVTFPSSGIDTNLGGIAYDSHMSRIYVANTSSGKVEYYSTSGSLGSSISSPCTCTPSTIAFDSNNNHIYVWWSGTGGGMSAYDETGSTVTLTGGSGTPFGGLSSPNAIVANTVNGYLYITDGTSVKVFDATGATISTLGTFSPGFTVTSANGMTIKP